MYKLLICGHNGFVGKFFFKHFQDYYTVYGADLNTNETSFEFKIDFTKFNEVFDLINKTRPDYIINLVGLNKGNKLNELIKVNVNSLSNILQTTTDINLSLKRIIHTSSSAVYGNKNLYVNENSKTEPINYYGLTKLMSENVCEYFIKNNNLNITIVRPSNIMGKELPLYFVIPKLIKKIIDAKNINQPNINLGNLEVKRDFIDISDVFNAYRLLLSYSNSQKVYNVSQNKSYSLKECVGIIFQEMNFYPDLVEENKKIIGLNDLICDNSLIINKGFLVKRNITDIIKDMINEQTKK